MQLDVTATDIGTSRPLVLLNTVDAAELGAHPIDRVRIEHADGTATGIVKRTDELVAPGMMGLTEPLHHVRGPVDVTLAGTPQSVRYVRKKLDDIELEAAELERIVEDIYEDRLSDINSARTSRQSIRTACRSPKTKHLTRAMAEAGQQLTWDAPVVADKHSIGGVAGNCVTPIVVSIVTEAGLTMPKTSSRAVTSPAGTADVMEVFCDVEFSIDGIESIVAETNGCLVWGGGSTSRRSTTRSSAPRTPSRSTRRDNSWRQSSKKKRSAGSTHVVIDIPYGEGRKSRASSGRGNSRTISNASARTSGWISPV